MEKEKETIIILMSAAESATDIELIKKNAVKMLGLLKTKVFNDNYLIFQYYGELSKSEKDKFSKFMCDNHDTYTVFIECTQQVIDKVKSETYLLANLAEQ